MFEIFGKILVAPIRATAYLIDGVDYLTSDSGFGFGVGKPLNASKEIHDACNEVVESFNEIDEN